MTQPNPNQPPRNPLPAFSQAHPPFQPQTQQLTEERVKEVIMETLIQLDLVPHAQKKKAITIE